MSSEALGGGVMVAVAAVLWVAYLMPTWSRRKQFQATERNAVRLQQTLRILAETAEVPQQVRLEANARTVAEQQRVLARAEQSKRAEAQAEAQAKADAASDVRRVAAAVAAAAAPRLPESPVKKLRRLRRFRRVVSLILLTGFVLAVSGIVPALAGSFSALVGGGVVMIAAFGILERLATVARSARIVRVEAPVARSVPIRHTFEPVQLEESPVAAATWTPQPVPRALHLSRGSIAQTAMASVEAANQLRRAAAEAEVARRAAALAEETNRVVTPIARPVVAATAAAVPNRFASMGIVGETIPGMTDLDAVLRRRRAV